MDAGDLRDVTAWVEILSVGTATVAVSIMHGLDPNAPDDFASAATVTLNTATNGNAIAGGYSGGTNVALAPYVQFKAVVTVTSGAVTWSATGILRK